LAGEGKHSGNKDDTLVNGFLESVDSISRNGLNILLIGTTNTIDKIEEAAKRVGRFQIVFFEYANDQESYNFLIDSVKANIESEYLISNDDNEYLISNDDNKLIDDKKMVIIEDDY
jgi:SpoVK/Ycf46/Vps4 family AAA+-type ATPase